MRCTQDTSVGKIRVSDSTRVVAQMTRLDHLLRFEPLADNLIIFMKKYGFERALCMHDVFKSRQFEFEFTFSAKRVLNTYVKCILVKCSD